MCKGGNSFFGIKFLFVNQFSKFLWNFKTFGVQNDDIVIFFLRSFRKVRFKMVYRQ